MMEKCDVLIIGAGPGGLAAAVGARKAGAGRVVILERDVSAGGILNQCVHDGFGLIRYNEQLTGPEYAVRAVDEALKAGAEILCGHQVIRISEDKTVIRSEEICGGRNNTGNRMQGENSRCDLDPRKQAGRSVHGRRHTEFCECEKYYARQEGRYPRIR